MHGLNMIHRDLKPDNIMMGLGDASNIVHLIDFGLTRLVIDPKTKVHIPFRTGKNLIGTCRYVSINAHLGYELSRRDDLLTLGHVVLNFIKGSLPWANVNVSKDSARYRELGNKKTEYSGGSLYDGIPPVFKTFMDYCNSLSFEQMPDYPMLKNLVTTAAQKAELDIFDDVFDWCPVLTRLRGSSEEPPESKKALDVR